MPPPRTDRASRRGAPPRLDALEVQRLLLAAALGGAAVLFWRGSLDVFNTTKATWIAWCAIGIVVAGSVRALGARTLELPRTRVWWPVLALLLALTVAAAAAGTPLRAVVGEPGRHTGLAMYATYALLFAVALRLHVERPADRVLGGLLVAAVPVTLYGLAQVIGWEPFSWRAFEAGPQVTSTFGNANFLAAWLGCVVPLGVWWALDDERPPRLRVAVAVLTVAALVVAVGSGSLQGVATAGVGLAIVGGAWMSSTPWSRRTRAVVATTAGALAALGVLAVALGLGPLGAVRDAAQDSLESRIGKWQAALTIAGDHPIVGVGPSAYGDHYERSIPDWLAGREDLERSVDDPHAVPLAMLTGGGIPAGLAYLGVVGFTGWALVRGLRRTSGRDRAELAALGGAWAGYQVQSLVSIDVPPLAALHWVLAGLIVARGTRPELVPLSLPGVRMRAGRVSPGWLAVIALVGAAAAWVASTPLRADLAAGAATSTRDAQEAVDAFERASALAPWEGLYPAREGGVLTELGFLAAARDQHAQAAEREPEVVVHAINMARLSAALEDHESAARWWDRAIALAPNLPPVLQEAGTYHLEDGDDDRAAVLFSRALDVRPDDPTLWTLLGRAYDELGDPAAARDALEQALALDPAFEPALTALDTL